MTRAMGGMWGCVITQPESELQGGAILGELSAGVHPSDREMPATGGAV